MKEQNDLNQDQNEVVRETIESVPVESQVVYKKKNLVLPIIVVIMLFAVLGIAAFFSYRHFSQNPTAIIKAIVNRSYEDFSKKLKENEKDTLKFDIEKDPMYMSGYLKFDDKTYKGLSDEKIGFAVGLDYKNKTALAKAELISKDKTLGDIAIHFQDDLGLLKSSTMFDNIYDVGEYKFEDMFDFSQLENVHFESDTDDIDYIVRELKDAFLDALQDDELTISKEKITIEGKNLATNKIFYNISAKSLQDMKNKISNSILNDDELIEKIAKVCGMTVKEIEDGLKEFKEESVENDLDGKFSIYTIGWNHEVVMIEFDDGKEKCYLTQLDDKAKFFYSDEEDNEVTVDIVKNGDEYKIIVNVDGEDVASFTINDDDDHAIIDYDITVDNVDLSGTLEINILGQTAKSMSADIKFSIAGSIDKTKIDYDIELNYDLELGKKIEKLDSKKALEEFTLGDSEKLMDKLDDLQGTALFRYFTQNMGNVMGLV